MRRTMSVKILSTAEDCTKKLSVCLCNVRQPHAAAAGLLWWARRPGDINRLLHGRKDLNETGSSYISLHSCLFRSNLFNQFRVRVSEKTKSSSYRRFRHSHAPLLDFY